MGKLNNIQNHSDPKAYSLKNITYEFFMTIFIIPRILNNINVKLQKNKLWYIHINYIIVKIYFEVC